ncbi:AMP-binding protein [Pusillimonas noertemannii]|uniref:AMP-binding protein n=1 Tax=Pusillimonas noertemannii TaxID=305977 RepID=UPI0002FA0C6C|nr:AMP-binding protein [Pusillimonas noertemannii]
METGAVSHENGRYWTPPVIDSLDSIPRIEARPYAQSVPFASTLDLILRNARQYPDTPALLFQSEPEPGSELLAWRYDELADQILRAGALLRHAGVSRDAPVAVIAPNIPSTHVALWGAQLAGCVFPINYLLGAEHIAGLLRAADVRVIVSLGHSEQLAIQQTTQEAVRLAGGERRVFEIDPDEAKPAPGSFQALLRATEPLAGLVDEISPDTTAAIFHTGGTTGLPKILRHSHRNELHTSCMAAAYYCFSHGDRLLNGFPLFHVAGVFVYGLAALAVGGTIYVPTLLGMRNQRFVANAWQLFKEHGISHLGCVPTTLASLAQSHEQAGVDGSCGVLAALTGGSSLPAEIASHFEARTGVPVRNIFGMTECAGIVAIEPMALPRTAGSVGLALPYTEVRALPLDEADKPRPDTFCAPGHEGVLCLRGPHVSPGYVDAARNAGTFTENGWLISGDLGYVDEQGRIFITGRSKDLIIRSGHNIDPQAIEEAFLANPDVLDCAAVGQPDRYAGELPVVFVTLKSEAACDAPQLLAKATPRIHERPAVPKQVHILKAMPTTPVGKIFKPALRRMAALNAVQDTLRQAGLLQHCEVELRDEQSSRCLIAVRDQAQAAAIENALRGLPVQCEIEVR